MKIKKKTVKKIIKPRKKQVKETAQMFAPKAKPEAETKPLAPELIQSPRGMRDILPADQKFWDALNEKARELSRAFGYGYIETPILEHKILFTRSVGEDTDIAQKEMYGFKDQGGDELVLRPEGTAAVARAYINHGMLNLPQPVKLWCMGQFFRRERPQSGRSRQFHQWCMEVLGDGHPILDAEVISIAMLFFKDLELPVKLEINSIGCLECRGVYKKELLDFYNPKRELLCKTCKARMESNPLRMLDCKEPQCELLREGAPQITDFLCEPCREHFMRALEYLDDVSVSYNLNPYLVRGLDYYSRTVFEIYPDLRAGEKGTEENKEKENKEEEKNKEGGEDEGGDDIKQLMGAQSALAGGGRYDGLIEQLGGRPTPGVGFSIGFERVVSFMRSCAKDIKAAEAPRVFIAQLGEGARRRALLLWHNLRKHLPAAASLSKDGLKVQLEIANRLQVRYAVIIGQKEVLDRTAIIRDMEGGIQEVVDYDKLVGEIKKRLGGREDK